MSIKAMRIFWFLLYNLFAVPLLLLGFRIASLFNEKIRKSLLQRRGSLRGLEEDLSTLPEGNLRVWFHCASLGEFERAKPLIAKLKERHKNISVVVSFFSPSGYENAGDYPSVDLICYLPLDSLRGASRFLRILRPRLAVVVMHDLWPNHLWELRSLKIPTFLVDGTLPQDSKILLPGVRSFFKSLLPCFHYILAASPEDAQRFKRVCPQSERILALGDTRYDQVFIRSQGAKGERILPEGILADRKVFLAGSTWPSDEKHLLPALERLIHRYNDLLMILVPHEPTPKRLREIEDGLLKRSIPFIRLSQLERSYSSKIKVLLVDRMGVLAGLYASSQVAFVGGGFGPGVHNVIEPAVMGNPVLFGPRMLNSPEARALVERGAGVIVKNADDICSRLILLWENPSLLKELGEKAKGLVLENLGAADRIIPYLEEAL